MSTSAPPRRSPNRTILITVALGLIVLVGVAVAAGTGALRPIGQHDPSGSGGPDASAGSPAIGVGEAEGYLVSATELRERAALAEQGLEPYRTALTDLVRAADEALGREPQPVNPLTGEHDRFLEDTHDAYTLALAWVVTDDARYADASASFITAWVDQVDATARTCPDHGGSGCETSLLVSRCAPGFVFAADLLDGSDALSSAEVADLKRWLSEVILPAASRRTNNWGDAGTFMRLAVADYVGDQEEFDAAVARWREMLDMVTSAGEIPEESRRGAQGMLYTQGAISYKVGAAAIAERHDIDLWGYAGAGGGTLRGAIDSLAHYWEHPDEWPYHRRVSRPSVDPAWEIIYQRWPEPSYAAVFVRDRPLGTTNPSAIIWTTLTHGEPIDEG